MQTGKRIENLFQILRERKGCTASRHCKSFIMETEDKKLTEVLSEYLFRIMIVTNPKCQITQQSRVYNWRPVKGFICLFQQRAKTTRTNTIRTMAKLFHFRVQLTPCLEQCNIDVIHINVRIIRFLVTDTFGTAWKISIIFQGVWVFENWRNSWSSLLEKWSVSDKLRPKKA